jgi:hypothetical protein
VYNVQRDRESGKGSSLSHNVRIIARYCARKFMESLRAVDVSVEVFLDLLVCQ